MVPTGRFFFLDRRAEQQHEATGLVKLVEPEVNSLRVFNDMQPDAVDLLMVR